MNRRYFGAVAGALLGAIVGATVGGLIGRGIALFGDPTVESVVPMVFCAILGYAIGGASGCKGSLDRIGAKRSTAGAVVAGVMLIASVVAAAALGSDTVAIFLVVLVAGLVLAGLAGAAIAGPGATNAAVTATGTRPPKLEVSRQTVSAPASPEALAFLAADEPEDLDSADVASADVVTEAVAPPPLTRPRRTRPLRAGDADESE